MYRNRKRKHWNGTMETLEKLDRDIKKEQTEIKNHPGRPDTPIQHGTTHNETVSTTSTPSIQLGLTYRSIRIGSYKVLKSKEMVRFFFDYGTFCDRFYSYFRCILLKTLSV